MILKGIWRKQKNNWFSFFCFLLGTDGSVRPKKIRSWAWLPHSAGHICVVGQKKKSQASAFSVFFFLTDGHVQKKNSPRWYDIFEIPFFLAWDGLVRPKQKKQKMKINVFLWFPSNSFSKSLGVFCFFLFKFPLDSFQNHFFKFLSKFLVFLRFPLNSFQNHYLFFSDFLQISFNIIRFSLNFLWTPFKIIRFSLSSFEFLSKSFDFLSFPLNSFQNH